MVRHVRQAVYTTLVFTASCVAHDPRWVEEPHHVSVLASGTFETDERAASVGLDYEYRVSGTLGLGTVAEYAFDEIDATTLLAVADVHLTDQWILQTGPGVEFVEGDAEVVYRFGALYEFDFEGYTLSPQVHYDWTSGHNAFVFGVAFGVAF